MMPWKCFFIETNFIYKPTDTLLVSGSAMTPMFFRSKSPMLRVIANLPLTFGCPRLFHVINPPLFFILEAGANEEKSKFTSTSFQPKFINNCSGFKRADVMWNVSTLEILFSSEELKCFQTLHYSQHHDMYLSFSSFLSGVWSRVSLRALPLRHSMARLSPTLATTSSMPSLRRATVAVVPAFIPGTTET